MSASTLEYVQKADSDHIENSKTNVGDPDRYSEKDIARIKRRIDIRLIPSLGLMFGISLMDRTNVSNAAIAGMVQDLDLGVGYRYSLITLCFFITYVLVQAPMTVVCRKLGPSLFLPSVCLAWGAVIIGFGFSKSWVILVVLRLILGVLEAGYFPGCVYLLSTWYTRCKITLTKPAPDERETNGLLDELAKRYSLFYLTGMLSSAFSGILAFGLMHMEGVQGIRGWSW